eukprot:5974640-Amphidinium_carterae.1
MGSGSRSFGQFLVKMGCGTVASFVSLFSSATSVAKSCKAEVSLFTGSKESARPWAFPFLSRPTHFQNTTDGTKKANHKDNDNLNVSSKKKSTSLVKSCAG